MNDTSALSAPEQTMLCERITIVNQLGLHTRAAAKLVALAGRFQSQIDIIRRDNQQKANCKSIMAIMLLGVTYGTVLDLLITGDDELEARDAIVALINDRFGEGG